MQAFKFINFISCFSCFKCLYFITLVRLKVCKFQEIVHVLNITLLIRKQGEILLTLLYILLCIILYINTFFINTLWPDYYTHPC